MLRSELTPVLLTRQTIDTVPRNVRRPSYRPEDLTAGIVHFGVGNFHRSHQASYLDRLFDLGVGRDWAVVGAGVMPSDERLRTILREQDFLSLLVTRSAESSEARITAPMINFLPVGDEGVVVTWLTDPAIRIVSLTVTEGGYFLDADGNFDAGHPAIQMDAVAPDSPRTVFGMILKALRLRRDAGFGPFTVMSCDNLPHNGKLTRGTVTGLASLNDGAFADWVGANVSFPNSMVDRITPATSDRERRIAREEYGVVDQWPVFSESFIQWVLEDDFPLGRPALERVGVTFVEDVTPYEEMKLRVLNASHAIIAYPAALLGIEYAHDAVVHPAIAPMLEKIQHEEIIPGVTSVPDMDPSRYFEIVRTRFANHHIADTTARLCYDGSNRQPKFIMPPIRHALAHDLPVDGLALASALWCRYCAGTRDDGTPIAPNDPRWDVLNLTAMAARTDPGRWLDQREIYGSVGDASRFRDAFSSMLLRLWEQGVVATITDFARR